MPFPTVKSSKFGSTRRPRLAHLWSEEYWRELVRNAVKATQQPLRGKLEYVLRIHVD